MTKMKLVQRKVSGMVMFIPAGCSFLPQTPYMEADANSSRVLDLGELRRYADESASAFGSAQTTVSVTLKRRLFVLVALGWPAWTNILPGLSVWEEDVVTWPA
jgi:hypothetical protein